MRGFQTTCRCSRYSTSRALPATDAELLAPLPSTYGSEELKQLIGKYKDVKESMGAKFTWDETKLDIEWH